MKHTFLFISLGLALLSMQVACKHDHEEDDTVAPTITINSPLQNGELLGIVTMTGNISDENSLHSLNIKITKDSDGLVLYTKEISAHDLTTYDFAETWNTPNFNALTPVTIAFSVKDHGDNVTSASVKCSIR